MKNKKNVFLELFTYSQALSASLINIRLILISPKKVGIIEILNEFEEQVLYIKTLLQNRLSKPIINSNINLLHGIFVRANNKGLYTNEKHREEVLRLINANDMSNLLKDLTEKCDSIIDRNIEINTTLGLKIYNERLLLEMEEQVSELQSYIRAIYVVIYLQINETDGVKFSSKNKAVRKPKLTLIK